MSITAVSRNRPTSPVDDVTERRHNAGMETPTLAALVRAKLGISWSKAKALCEQGRVTVDGERVLDPAARVMADSDVVVDPHAPKVRPRGPLPEGALVAVERDFVVVDKPALVLSVADEPGNTDTLFDHVRTLLRRSGERDTDLVVVHRLDRDTSGLMVFARTAQAKRVLAAQFRAHDMERRYVAIAHGEVRAARIHTFLLEDRGDGLRGSYGHYRRASGPPPAGAREAITNVRPLEALRGATLVECRLETGRQHQVRIHLAEAGHALVGERVYIRDHAGARIEAPRTMLHARTLGFTHPRSGKAMRFEREPPGDFDDLLDRLRA
jgi:23S rRNA pseudouridine1911/1915/1917 synthase